MWGLGSGAGTQHNTFKSRFVHNCCGVATAGKCCWKCFAKVSLLIGSSLASNLLRLSGFVVVSADTSEKCSLIHCLNDFWVHPT